MFSWLTPDPLPTTTLERWTEQIGLYLEWPFVRAGVFLLMAVVAALWVRLLFTRVFSTLAGRTESDIDDLIIGRLSRPVTWSVFLLGLWYSLAPLHIQPSGQHLVQGVLGSLVIVIWCVAGLSVAKLVLERLSLDPDGSPLVKPRTLPVFTFIAHAAIFLSAAYFFFLAWEIDITGWLASAGIVGIAVGFAAKDTLANLFAGVFIVADGPYKIGDYLILENGDRGRVAEIGMRSTRIQTLDNVQVVVPNANLANSTIMNLSGGSSEQTRISVNVGVAYDSDMDAVRACLLTLAKQVPRVLKAPKPIVRVHELQDSCVALTLRVWIGKPEWKDEVLDTLNCQILVAFREAGISIPFPQREVQMLNGTSATPPTTDSR
jgi:MscS family membrane protein